MHLLKNISYVALITLILLSSIGCATRGELSDDGVVNLNHFSFSRPENTLWMYGYNRSRKEHYFRLTSGEVEYSINFKEIPVSKGAHLLKGTRDSAAYFVFLSLSVGSGDQTDSIKLKGPNNLGQYSVNDKKFYALDYTVKNIDYCSNEEAYLYFPFEEQNTYFLSVHYKEIAEDCLKATETIDSERQAIQQDFRNFLGTLVHRL